MPIDFLIQPDEYVATLKRKQEEKERAKKEQTKQHLTRQMHQLDKQVKDLIESKENLKNQFDQLND